MTMPHLMNCGHSDDGWCLDCVKALHAQLSAALQRAEAAEGKCRAAETLLAPWREFIEGEAGYDCVRASVWDKKPPTNCTCSPCQARALLRAALAAAGEGGGAKP
jgi:hypothetical protein